MMGPMSGPAIQSIAITPTLGQGLFVQRHTGIVWQREPAILDPGHGCIRPQPYCPDHLTPGGDRSQSLGRHHPGNTGQPANSQKYAAIQPTPTPSSTDPRPWLEKFFEGQRGYYFIINSQYINSYTLKILIPTRYIGQY